MNSEHKNKSVLKELKVLYVEDEADAREQFTQFLNRIVGTLVVAQNGAEGLDAYLLHHPQIIITDIQMPVMDGLMMAQQIRKLDQNVPIIVLTAFEQVDYLKRSINIGINKYVTKPVNGFELHKALLECTQSLLTDEALRAAARTDLLTGLANRRELSDRFQEEKSLTERHGTCFSLIMLDIDHFKTVNDSYGHLAGDRILANIARTLTTSLRTEDICGRWGGEEFLLILPNINLSAAAIVAEKLRNAIGAMQTDWEGQTITVTISLGVAEFKAGTGMHECIAAADAALYRAKNGGRNRTELATEHLTTPGETSP